MYKMELYCLNCRKNTENANPKISVVVVMVEWWYYPNAQYVIVKNQDLLKTKKEKDD